MKTISFTQPGQILIDPKLQPLERADTIGNPQLDFADSFGEIGWEPSQGIVTVFKGDEATIKRCLDYRRERLLAWKQAPLIEHEVGINDDGGKRMITGEQLLVSAESIWNDSDGNLCITGFVGIANCCNRRLEAEVVCVASYKAKHNGAVYEVPYIVAEYNNDDDKMLARLRENAKPGTSPYSPLNKLHMAIQLVRLGNTEAQLHKHFGHAKGKRGESQRLHTWAQLCRKHTKLNLFARFRMPRPKLETGQVLKYQGKDKYLDFTRVTPTHGRSLLGKCKLATAIDDTVVDVMGERTPAASATSAHVEEFLKRLHNGAVNAKKVMNKANLEVLKGSAPSGLLETLMTAITEDNSEGVSAMYDAYTEHEADQLVLIQELRETIKDLESQIVALKAALPEPLKGKKANGKK